MANITIPNPIGTPAFGGTPYGNTWNRHRVLKTNANGSVQGAAAGQVAPVAINDVIRLGLLPRGMRLDTALAIVATTFTATATADIGFLYVDGVDDTPEQAAKESREYVPQNAGYFFAALAYNALGRTWANNTAVKPVTLPKDAYLVLVNKGAALAKASELHLIVYGEDRGPN